MMHTRNEKRFAALSHSRVPGLAMALALVAGIGCQAGSSEGDESDEAFGAHSDDVSESVKIAISGAMVVAESAGKAGNFQAIADEQAVAGDPRAGKGGSPVTTWSTAFDSTLYPMSVYIDLGQEYELSDIYLYDANNTTGVTVSTGKPGAWQPLYTQALDQYKTWRGKAVSVKTRYVRFTKPSATTNFSEVVLYGKPVVSDPGGGGAGGGSPSSPVACTLVAQGGECDFIVTPKQGTSAAIATTSFDGAASGVQAGDRVCLQGGSYPYSRLQLSNIVGGAASYVTVSNCGAKFTIGNDGGTSRGIEIKGSKYFYLSGTGSAQTYGIEIAGTSSGLSALSIGELSTDYEVDHVEIRNAGFAGIMAKTEPGCSDTDPNSFRGGFVQRNTHFHDNFIHDVNGEGFYVGYSFPNGRVDDKCPGSPTVYSHPIENVKIYDNVLESTGCEAIQVGMTKNADVHHNYVDGFGLSPFANYQNNGIQIGGKSGGKVHENIVVNPNPSFQVAHGIILLGWTDQLVYSNTIVNPANGVYIHKDVPAGTKVTLVNNTIVNPTGDMATQKQGIGVWSNNSGAIIKLVNNLIVLGPDLDASKPESALPGIYGILDGKQGSAAQQQGVLGANITATNNLVLPKSQGNVFVNPAAYDFRSMNAAVHDKGVDVAALGALNAMSVDEPNKKVSSTSRKQGAATDIGAFETP